MAARPEITFGQFLPVLSGIIATESNVATRIDILWNAADGGRGEGGAGGETKIFATLEPSTRDILTHGVHAVAADPRCIMRHPGR